MAKPPEPVSRIEWAAPPPGSRYRYDWAVIADQLRAHPMEWARIFEYDRSSIAGSIARGNVNALRRDLGFEVRTTNNTREEPRMCSLFMRFNPSKVVR